MHAIVWIVFASIAIVAIAFDQDQFSVSKKQDHLDVDDQRCAATESRPSNWGHLYFHGRVESIEFFTSMFSDQFPCEALSFVYIEDFNGCSTVENDTLKNKAVLVNRGDCSFSQKASYLAGAGAAAMIVVNKLENELFPMPDSDVSTDDRIESLHNTIPSIMIRERSGQLLKHSFDTDPSLKIYLRGEYASDNLGQVLRKCGSCIGELSSPLNYETEPIHGGKLYVSKHQEFLNQNADQISSSDSDHLQFKLDFFAGYVGSSLPVRQAAMLVAMDHLNAFACEPIDRDFPHGSIVIVKRGKCTYSEKVRNLHKAGAFALLVVNSESEIALPGFPDKDLDPFQINYNPGTILATPIVFNGPGNNLYENVLDSSDPFYIRFVPSQMKIQDVKQLKSIDSLSFWPSEPKATDVLTLAKQLGLDIDTSEKLSKMIL